MRVAPFGLQGVNNLAEAFSSGADRITDIKRLQVYFSDSISLMHWMLFS